MKSFKKADMDPIAYQKRLDSSKKWHQQNRDKLRAYDKTYRAGNVQYDKRRKNYALQRAYGITLEQFDGMIEEQQNKCHICGIEMCIDKIADNKACVDHNHTTGKARGILCGSCNRMIGIANDNIKILKSAIKYLEKYGDIT